MRAMLASEKEARSAAEAQYAEECAVRAAVETAKAKIAAAKVEVEADLLYARDAETHDEFADRLRKLHELTVRCNRYGTTVSACGKKEQFRVRVAFRQTWPTWRYGPTRQTRV